MVCALLENTYHCLGLLDFISPGVCSNKLIGIIKNQSPNLGSLKSLKLSMLILELEGQKQILVMDWALLPNLAMSYLIQEIKKIRYLF